MKIQSEIWVKKYESVFIDEKLVYERNEMWKDGKFIKNIELLDKKFDIFMNKKHDSIKTRSFYVYGCVTCMYVCIKFYFRGLFKQIY